MRPNTLKNRVTLTFLTLTCLFFAMASTSFAKRIKFPNNDPEFTLELPAKWTFEDDKDGNLNCYPNDDSGYAFSIVILEQVKSQKELKAAVSDLAKEMAKAAKIEDFELGKVETGKNGSDISFTGVRGDGKVAGTDFVVLVHGFEAKKGKFYAIVTAGSSKADKKHVDEYDDITASIEALD
jgi:hypothetical protein